LNIWSRLGLKPEQDFYHSFLAVLIQNFNTAASKRPSL
jgi:hypothetical protein